ncbi:MAG: family 78 glycoside hydrolase catalytic domain [Clostridia bacterium]|nr:family 78 glycoside hydrolase catalytic domain [Clostridia bacterium]
MKFSEQFISATKKYTTFFEHIPAPLLRKEFDVKNELQSACITICGLGFYKLYINGKDITKGLLAPYISNPDHIVYYDCYDIAPLLKKGRNAIGIMLGNGMLNCPGGIVWDFDKEPWRSAPKTALCVELEYKNGETAEFESDESFKCSESPIWFDDLRCGVFYNALKEQKGWSEPGFDDSGWKNAFFCEKPRGEARLCEADPITAQKRIAPVSIKKGAIKPYIPGRKHDWTSLEMPATLEGHIFDFGVNSAGVFEFKVSGAKPGTRVEFFTAEMLDDDGDINNTTFSDFYPVYYAQRDIYICKGGEESFIPDFTYHGYRYCLVTGLDNSQVSEDTLTYIAANSSFDEVGGFECSDDVLNALQNAARISDLANFWYFPTDCPHREKNGWTGDASVSAEHMLLNLTVEKSYLEWLRNIRKAMREDGSLPGVVPTGSWGYKWGNGPAWDSVLTFLPFFTYKYRGDKKIIEENADAFLRYVNHLANSRDSDGLIAIGLGDWLHPNRGAGDPKCPLIVTDSIISMAICERAAFMLGEIGKTAQRDFAQRIADELRASIRKHLVSFNKMTVLSDTQTALALAIHFGVFESSEIPLAVNRLVEIIHSSHDLLDGGYLSGRYLFHVLSDNSYASLAYKMIKGPDFPSYGWMLNQGATSMWESFYTDHKDSLNHHFWGDVSAWFIKAIAGIDYNPDCSDTHRVDIRPNFIEGLNSAQAFHICPHGKITSSWKVDGDNAVIEIAIPENCRGRLYLPDGWKTDASEYPRDGVDYFNLKSLNNIKLIRTEMYNKNQYESNNIDFFNKC